MIRIPDELVALAAERRLIPFLGAGFSNSLGLPTWETMLRSVCEGVEQSIPFDDLVTATNGDLLQIAEYLYLKHDRQIGPIRHQIERSFSTHSPQPLSSGPHVELVNLGAGQIYTTNYDDVIEQAYRALFLPVSSVILPKDVALADTDRTQVVKYHGDLAHERTLVLTESAYYKRLDFESPMDLKFRSDLLGKSVLFMGYSFRDINIRIIWFKLMEMMKDIPEADRRPSYIVRIDPNPALEELYAAVGLKTIVLNSSDEPLTAAERSSLVGQFLFDLSSRASTRALTGEPDAHTVYVSVTALENANRMREHLGSYGTFRARGGVVDPRDPVIRRLFHGEIPAPLVTDWQECVVGLLPYLDLDSNTLSLIERLPASSNLTQFAVAMLQTSGDPDSRPIKQELIANAAIWPKIWEFDIPIEEADEVLDSLLNEIYYQASRGADEDIVYLAELAKRIEKGLLAKDDKDAKELRKRAAELLKAAERIYPAIARLDPSADDSPRVTELLAQVAAREGQFAPIDLDFEQLQRNYLSHRTRIRRTVGVPPE